MDRTSGRLRILALLVVMMFIALTTRLWFLQVLASGKNRQISAQNRTRTVETPALRGNILDAHGNLLVGNRLSLQVQVNQQDLGANKTTVLTRLASLLAIPLPTLQKRLASVRYFPYAPIPVAFDVPKQVSWYIAEHAERFPGVSVVEAPISSYPDATLAAHILGYVGPITATQFAAPAFNGYGQNDIVGQAGLELQYEHYLQGTKGKDFYLVNAAGKQVRTIGTTPALPGDNVVLSIDARIQQLAEQQLLSGIMKARGITDSATGQLLQASAGAVVVMDPQTGGVVAMASWPSFDPRWFVQGMTGQQYRMRFNLPRDGSPALNRAENQVYAPGSTFKSFIALAALKSGVANESSYYPCPSIYYYPGDITHTPFHNFEGGSSVLQLATALTVSCDTVFYGFGASFFDKSRAAGSGTDILSNDLLPFGFGSPTGIDLPFEAAGTLPGFDYALQHKSVYPYGWLAGNSILTAIGQDSVAVTPLQLATAYSAIANGGKLCRPHLADHIETPEGKTVKTMTPKCHPIPYTAQQVQFVRGALTGVTTAGGTAGTAFAGFPISVAGKTGTAQRPPFQDTAWFAGMAPAGAPKYVVVAMVEQGGFGGITAAPIVRHIMEGLFHLPQTNPIKTGP